jgi:hypothetical protein
VACEDIEKQISALQSQAKDIEAVLPGLKGAGQAVAQENLANIKSQISAEQQQLDNCRKIAQPAAPKPFSGRVKQIYCLKAGAEIGKQEPYVLVGSFDMLGQVSVAIPVPIPKPAVQCFKVGPWAGIAPGSRISDSKLADRDRPKFWDLDGKQRIVKSPQDVAFIAALVENDGSSPDAIRGAVGTALEVAIVNNMGRAYGAFVDTMSSVMAGAIDSFAGAGVAPGHLNFDDRLSPVMQITLAAWDLQTINALGKLEKVITFQRKNSDKVTDEYEVTFSFET